MAQIADNSGHWRLFKSLRPVFASAIPWEAQNGNQDDAATKTAFRTTIKLIKTCMQEIPIHVPMHLDTVDGFLSFLADDLRPMLFTLQELVLDDILYHPFASELSVFADPRLPKLHVLSHLVQRSEVFEIQDYLQFIRLRQDLTNLSKIKSSIANLNERLVTSMSADGPDRVAVPIPQTKTSALVSADEEWCPMAYGLPLWNASHQLYEALLHNHTLCTSSEHSAMFCLRGVKPPNPQQEQTEFSILLSPCTKKDSWQEASCRVFYNSSSIPHDVNDFDIKRVCVAALEAHQTNGMLHVNVSGERSWYDCTADNPIYPQGLPSVALSQLIQLDFLKGLRVFPLKHRSKLALNLANSLLQLHSGPWLQSLWTSDCVYFLCDLKDANAIVHNIHTAFITCSISDTPPSIPEQSHCDKFPFILSFGQFLLELAIGEKLPVSIRENTGQPLLRKTLMNNFKHEEILGSLNDNYQEAISGCLDFHKYIKQENYTDEADKIRATIYKRIIRPLELNLLRYGESPASINIRLYRTVEEKPSVNAVKRNDSVVRAGIMSASARNMSLAQPRTSLPLSVGRAEVENPNHLGNGKLRFSTGEQSGLYSVNVVQLQSEQTIRQVAGITTLRPAVSNGAGSDSETEVNMRGGSLLGSFDTTGAALLGSTVMVRNKTFNNLLQTYRTYFQFSHDDVPVKIAVLDTGFDHAHPDFQNPRCDHLPAGKEPYYAIGEVKQVDRIKARRNFCDDDRSDEDVTDIDGHGTHVAGIILQLAPRADLFIARVCQGNAVYGGGAKIPEKDVSKTGPKQFMSAKRVHPDRVERAIHWAIKQEVQVINMSFGFKDWDPKVEQALKKAGDNGIVVIAAASNSGNHELVAWPARDKDLSICVHSSIDEGTRSSRFTPKADTETTNFMVVGEDISSHWPVSKCGGFRSMSGTSTATPVVTATVALLLAFIHQTAVDTETKEQIEKGIGVGRYRGLTGMRRLLKHISLYDKVGEYYWIRPKLLWWNYNSAMSPGKSTSIHAWNEIGKALKR